MTEEHANEGELSGPALYLLWPNQRTLPEVPSLPPEYRICAVASERVDQARPIVEADGVVTDREWQRYRDSLVPDGLFAILDRQSSEWVGCIGAAHNPAATRFYFPGGGELGYLVVRPDHRRRGLGSALIASATRRLHQGGYRHIFLGVEGRRLPAIRAYLRAGFQPFQHASGLAERWRSVFAALGRQPRESEWLTGLAELVEEQ